MGYNGLGPLVPQKREKNLGGKWEKSLLGSGPLDRNRNRSSKSWGKGRHADREGSISYGTKKNEVTPSRLPCAAAIIVD